MTVPLSQAGPSQLDKEPEWLDTKLKPTIDGPCIDGHKWQDDFEHATRYCEVCGIAGAQDLEHYDKDAIGESFGASNFIHQLSATSTGLRAPEISRYQNEKLREAKLQIKDVCNQLEMVSQTSRVIYILESALEYSKLPRRGNTFKFGKQSICFEMAAIKYCADQDGRDLSYEHVSSFFAHLVADNDIALLDQGRSGKPRITKTDVARQTHFIEWLARHNFKPRQEDEWIEPGFEGGKGKKELAEARIAEKKRRAELDMLLGKRKIRDEDPPGKRSDYIPDVIAAFDRDMSDLVSEMPTLAEKKDGKSARYLRAVRKQMHDVRTMANILADVLPCAKEHPRDIDVRSESAIIVLIAMQAAYRAPAPKNTLFYPMITRLLGARAPLLGGSIKHTTDWLNNQLFAQPWFDLEGVFAHSTFRAKKITQRSGQPKAAVTVKEWKPLIMTVLGKLDEEEEEDDEDDDSGKEGEADNQDQVHLYRIALQRAKVLLAAWRKAGGTPPEGLRWGDIYAECPASVWGAEDGSKPQMPTTEDGKPLPPLVQYVKYNHADIDRYIGYMEAGAPLHALFEDPLHNNIPRELASRIAKRITAAGGMETVDSIRDPETLDAILFEPEELESLVRTNEEANYFARAQGDQLAVWEEHSRLNNKKLDERQQKEARAAKRQKQEERRQEQAQVVASQTPRVRKPLFEENEEE